jgi:hypothetical protein
MGACEFLRIRKLNQQPPALRLEAEAPSGSSAPIAVDADTATFITPGGGYLNARTRYVHAVVGTPANHRKIGVN